MPADPIEHVIVLMLENRSFDHMLGVLQSIYPKLEGIPPQGSDRYDTDSSTGNRYQQLPNEERRLDPSPLHEHRDVMRQIANQMSGFIDDYATVPGSKPANYPAVMGYYPMDFLPVLHTLARNFTICDHWFSSLPGPTWPNRFFAESGTCNGHVAMPEGFFHPNLPSMDQPQDTIFNRLQEKGISWGIFHYGLPISLVLRKLWDHPFHFHEMDQFYAMCKEPDKADARLPQYCFIEPDYRGPDENDQHPPADVMNGEILIANVYNAVRNSPIWNKCLLVVTYDEHGGFYDHVVPPNTAIPPEDYTEEFSFTQYGPRVPALLISPRAPKTFVDTVFDHTSILRYVSDKWDLTPLTKRSAGANSIGSALDMTGPPRDDVPMTVQPSQQAYVKVPSDSPSVTNHQQALLSFSRYLDTWMHHEGEDAIDAYKRLESEYSSLDSKIEVARQRFRLFLSGKAHEKKGITIS